MKTDEKSEEEHNMVYKKRKRPIKSTHRDTYAVKRALLLEFHEAIDFKCFICGKNCRNNPYELEFMHNDRKTKARSKSGRTRCISSLPIDEMRKERLIGEFGCHECHIKATIEERKHLLSNTKGAGRTRTRRKRLYDFVNVRKLGVGCCELCGTKVTQEILQAFDWDHIDPKTKFKEVSQMIILNFTTKELTQEMDLCQLLCRPCHRRTTAEYNIKQRELKKDIR